MIRIRRERGREKDLIMSGKNTKVKITDADLLVHDKKKLPSRQKMFAVTTKKKLSYVQQKKELSYVQLVNKFLSYVPLVQVATKAMREENGWGKGNSEIACQCGAPLSFGGPKCKGFI